MHAWITLARSIMESRSYAPTCRPRIRMLCLDEHVPIKVVLSLAGRHPRHAHMCKFVVSLMICNRLHAAGVEVRLTNSECAQSKRNLMGRELYALFW